VAEQSSLVKTSKCSSDLLLFIRCKFTIKPRASRGLLLSLDGEVTIDGAVATIDASALRGTSGVMDGAIVMDGGVVMDDAVAGDGSGGSRDARTLGGTKLGMTRDQFDDN
jgi:hypothetical protein